MRLPLTPWPWPGGMALNSRASHGATATLLFGYRLTLASGAVSAANAGGAGVVGTRSRQAPAVAPDGHDPDAERARRQPAQVHAGPQAPAAQHPHPAPVD